MAPVNLNDEEKLKKFYRHKFSLGYVYGLIIAFLQVADFMRENEKVLHEMLTVAMMKQLFNFKEKTARDFFNKAQTTFRKDQVFMQGIAAGANDWTLFYKENCKGMMGQHFDQAGFNIMKKDLE